MESEVKSAAQVQHRRLSHSRWGTWSLLLVQLPGQSVKPAGILLVDPNTNRLHIKLDESLAIEDDEVCEVWQLLRDDLMQKSEELGGAETLEILDATLSNVFQVSDLTRVQVAAPDLTLEGLFEQYVDSNRHFHNLSSKTLRVPFITRDDLWSAQGKLPVFPSIALEAWTALGNHNHSDQYIESLISRDPSLAAYMVRVANLAYYAYAGRFEAREVRTISEAVRRLGTKVARRHVLGFCVGPLFSRSGLHKLWQHSLTVAESARQLARLSKSVDPEEALLLGLIHDIGQIVFAVLDDPLRNRFMQPKGIEYPLVYSESISCARTHAEIGADFLEGWNFPSDMANAVRQHHELDRPSSPLACVLHLAEARSENPEDVYGLDDHAYAMSVLRLQPSRLSSVSATPEPDLAVLSLTAGVGAIPK